MLVQNKLKMLCIAIPLTLILQACSTSPTVKPLEGGVEIPKHLKQECVIHTRLNDTVLDLAETYIKNQQSLMECNARLRAILLLLENK